MAEFNFSQYEEIVSKAQNSTGATQQARVGYFKLDNGAEALVRINIQSVDQIRFASVHKPIFGRKFEGLGNPYAGICCLNELGSYSDNCPLCKAAAAGDPVIGKAEKKCYIPMLVSYKDATTGAWSAPVAVVWERTAGYAREIATKLQNYGDLTQHLFKMTRTGAGKDTRYILDYAVPAIFKPEMIPADFSAFNNFDLAKHSYYKKPAEELMEFVAAGKFVEASQTASEQTQAPQVTPIQPAATTFPPVTPTATTEPARNFTGTSKFSF